MYTVYKTTCLINGKFYFGVHKTETPMDDYLGSGVLLKKSIQKYGRNSFIKEIILQTEHAHEAYAKEAELVTPEMLESKLCYNLKLGGEGGWDFVNKIPEIDSYREIGRQKTGKMTSQKVKVDVELRNKLRENASIACKSRTMDQILKGSQSWNGRKHKAETKKLMSEKATLRKAEKNSQFGTYWINNGKKAKKHRGPLPEGWTKGRKI